MTKIRHVNENGEKKNVFCLRWTSKCTLIYLNLRFAWATQTHTRSRVFSLQFNIGHKSEIHGTYKLSQSFRFAICIGVVFVWSLVVVVFILVLETEDANVHANCMKTPNIKINVITFFELSSAVISTALWRTPHHRVDFSEYNIVQSIIFRLPINYNIDFTPFIFFVEVSVLFFSSEQFFHSDFSLVATDDVRLLDSSCYVTLSALSRLRSILAFAGCRSCSYTNVMWSCTHQHATQCNNFVAHTFGRTIFIFLFIFSLGLLFFINYLLSIEISNSLSCCFPVWPLAISVAAEHEILLRLKNAQAPIKLKLKEKKKGERKIYIWMPNAQAYVFILSFRQFINNPNCHWELV